MSQLQIFQDSQALAKAAAEKFIQLADQSIRNRGRFLTALSGGSTPKTLYRVLAMSENQSRLDWSGIHLFFGDERHVPHTHPDSNYRMVREALLNQIDIPTGNIHRVSTEMDVQKAALSYEAVMREFFEGEWPQFDLVFLGMGEDGHTASLFPHSAGLNEEAQWFIANFAPKRDAWRLTLTKHAINAARNIIILVSGRSKAGMLEKVLLGPKEPTKTPIQLISPRDGQMIWMLDSDGAECLPKEFITNFKA